MHPMLEILHSIKERPGEDQCEESTWDNLGVQASEALRRAIEVHVAKCRTGNITLQDIYEEKLEEAARWLRRMGQVHPLFIIKLRSSVLPELEARIEQQILLSDILELVGALDG